MTHLRSFGVLGLAIIISIIFIAGEAKSENFEGFEETTHDDPNWCIVISDLSLTYYKELDDYCFCFSYLWDPCCVVNGVVCGTHYYKLATGVNQGHMFPISSLGDICRCAPEICPDTIDSLYVREGYSFQLYYNEASPVFCGPKRVSHTYARDCGGYDPPCMCPMSEDPATFYVPSSGYGALGDVAIIVYRGCAGIEKIDDVPANQCVLPGTDVNYTINYAIDGSGISQNVRVIDYLPVEVNYISSTSPSDYDDVNRIVTWYLGNLTLPAYGSVGLTVQVKDSNQSGYIITNVAEIQGNFANWQAKNEIFVCYSGDIGENIICVDLNAVGGLNDGTSWDNAFLDFNDALAKARYILQTESSCEIWVAGHPEGYKPPVIGGNYYSATFKIPDGNISIRGHFGGKARYETSPDQRDFNNPAFETFLDGRVGPNPDYDRANYVITCENVGLITTLIFDGFTFTGAGNAGLYINHSNPSIIQCELTGNNYYGISDQNYSYPDIIYSTFLENGFAGIYSDHSAWPWVKNCVFDGNNTCLYGLWGNYCEMLIEDCVIKRYSVAYDGAVYFLNSYLTIIGCTIENNSGANGILCLNCNYVEVTDCTIQNNGIDGINCYHSPLNVNNCNIRGNRNSGIETSESSVPAIANTKIFDNTHYGIYTDNCENIVMINNWIYHNGISGYDSGLSLRYSISPPFVRNNTITKNSPFGVYVAQGQDPCLINDIIWQNGDGPSKNIYSEWGLSGIVASYCDIGGGFSGTGNINMDPCFVKIDANDFHLKYDSPCIDVGDPNADYSDEFDIDGQCRVIYGKTEERADIGADEFFTRADYSGDSIVNYSDFAILAAVWKSANNPSITLDDDNDVDINDLNLFCENWLWYAPCFPLSEMLAEQSEGGSGMAAGAQESDKQSSAAETVEEPVTDITAADENPTDNISQPVSDEQIQILIDWAEQIWQTDPELQEMIDPNDYQHFIDLLKEELND